MHMARTDGASILVLDATPLGKLAHSQVSPIRDWLFDMLASGRRVVLPELADYEVRRGLLHKEAVAQLRRLDELKQDLAYQPITTDIMMQAARVWADAKGRGRQFTHDHALSGDAILIAQTQALGDKRSVTVISSNARHLRPYVRAMGWHTFEP